MVEVKLSSKNQIVIPREAREALNLKAGDRVMVVIRGGQVLILERPKSHRAALSGLGKGLYPVNHVAKERQSWR
jgi:AbrB family looped-hinge helix DNA binding protein